MQRCSWAKPGLLEEYHDREWGVPLHDDQKFFEFLVLDAFQAGLSWEIVLKKREGLRKAFASFDPARIAHFSEAKLEKLLYDPGIIRNRLKIAATITNARAFLRIQKEFGSFDAYIWPFVGGKPIKNAWNNLKQIPARNPESDALSLDLKAREFRFVGSTICYAMMQAAGLYNDHLVDCFRYKQIKAK
jgi:DNA-3-methyladenine glycosylase I